MSTESLELVELTEGAELAERPGRRERKKHALRQALHEAAMTMTEARGLSSVTVEAITDAVDVATRTFFNYYSSKEEAVLGPRSDPSVLAAGATQRIAAGQHPLLALQATLLADAVLRDTTSERLRRRMELLRSEPTLLAAASAQWDILSRSLVDAVAGATGLDADADPYPALVVMLAIAAIRAAMMRWVDHPDVPLATVVDESFRLLRAGMPHPAAPATGFAALPLDAAGART